MELASIIVIVLIFYLLSKWKKDSTNSNAIQKNFLPPLPKNYRIYEDSLSIAGISFYKDQAIRFVGAKEHDLQFERDKHNRHDANAIKIIGISKNNHYLLGHVPKEIAAKIEATELFHEIKPRLRRIYMSERGFIDIQFQIIGPNKSNDTYNRYDRERPADTAQIDCLNYFNCTYKSSITTAEAANLISQLNSKCSHDEWQEWLSYSRILEEFMDPEFLEAYEIKKISKSKLITTLEILRSNNKSYIYLEDNPDLIADTLLENQLTAKAK